MFKRLFVVLVSVGLLAVANVQEMLNLVSRPPLPEWSWNVSEQGELEIKMAGNRYTQSTRNSYPDMKDGEWNTVPGKSVVVSRGNGNVAIQFKCPFYTMEREIKQTGPMLDVRETYTNVSGEDQAIAFDQIIRSEFPLEPQQILCAGVFKSPAANSPVSPQSNSTLFFVHPTASLGVVLEDDFYRLQTSLKRDESCGIVENRSFGLAPGKSHTFEYSFHPTGQGDYYDFINRIRRRWKVNTRLDGNLALATSPHKELCAKTFNEMAVRRMQQELGVKLFSYANSIWFGNNSNFSFPGAPRWRLHDKHDSIELQMEMVRQAVANAKTISPDIKVFVLIQTLFAGKGQLPGEPIPFEDSIIIDADGKPKCKIIRDTPADGQEEPKIMGTIHYHYPAVGNSYFDYLMKVVDQAMDAGAQGIYFDTFTYAAWTKYGRWTYDRWDGCSVDIDTTTWRILKKKQELPLLVEEAQLALLRHIKERGGFMIFNHTAFTRKQCELLPHTMSFVESRGPVLASNRHLSHPTNLGYYPGYKYLEDEWKSPNGMFLNAMENLDWGCLTYVYWPQSPLQEKNFVRHFFPITVKNIYAGCVEGEEKIITNRSGFYTFHDAMRPKVLIYDANGVERTQKPGEAVCSMKNGLAVVELHLPTGGAAVLFRGEGIEKALEDELN